MTAMRTSKSFVLDASGGADTYYTELFRAEATARRISAQVQRKTGTGTITATLQGGWASSADDPMVPGSGYGVAEQNALYIKTLDGPEVFINSGDAAAPVWGLDSGTLRSGAGAPGAVNGTGYGAAELGALYIKTAGKAIYLNSGDANMPAWVLDSGTMRSGAGAPIDRADGTGFGTAEHDALYVKTVGKVLYKNSGDAVVPVWVSAGGTDRSGAGAPIDGIRGTGYGVAETGALFIKTAGKVIYKNTGTASVPNWDLAGGTDRSGAGAPEDGVTAGDLGDYYSDTTAYGNDPLTGWYVCTDGDLDTWAVVTATVLSGAATPVDGRVGTAGDEGDFYSNTTAYGNDPTTGWYVCTDATYRLWDPVTVTVLADSDAPLDGVAGTAGDTDDFYSDTTAYGNDPKTGWYRCTNGTLRTWVPVSATILSGAGFPVNGKVTTNGDTNDFYVDTTAYALDPTTGWYQCDNGTNNTWVPVAVTIISGRGAPLDHVAATATDWVNLNLYTGAVATDQLTELKGAGGDNYLFASFPCYRLKLVVGAAAATGEVHVEMY